MPNLGVARTLGCHLHWSVEKVLRQAKSTQYNRAMEMTDCFSWVSERDGRRREDVPFHHLEDTFMSPSLNHHSVFKTLLYSGTRPLCTTVCANTTEKRGGAEEVWLEMETAP